VQRLLYDFGGTRRRISQSNRDIADVTRSHVAPHTRVEVNNVADLRKRIGSPFRQGDVLFQLARLDTLYAELEVAERDTHEILEAREAEHNGVSVIITNYNYGHVVSDAIDSGLR